MNSYKKRKGRRIGGEDGSELRASQEQDPEVSGQKPTEKHRVGDHLQRMQACFKNH
ncbi:hypothetical protein CISG_09500 [Coccidioides immitis RMSCC 3703]|uniref:Uncharacterized protein n=1 Tax=Coccidioides immitis RMSCC 3703 TaxID=454286 RepID=A0A0J8TFU2_COCIT|nr:hypothetical protein CISG_09500 [Coccidioides immitis RMSCC 3703]